MDYWKIKDAQKVFARKWIQDLQTTKWVVSGWRHGHLEHWHRVNCIRWETGLRDVLSEFIQLLFVDITQSVLTGYSCAVMIRSKNWQITTLVWPPSIWSTTYWKNAEFQNLALNFVDYLMFGKSEMAENEIDSKIMR